MPPRSQLDEHLLEVASRLRIRRERKSLKLSQDELATRVRCSQAYISKIELGKQRQVSEEIALRIADAIGVRYSEVFNEVVVAKNHNALSTIED